MIKWSKPFTSSLHIAPEKSYPKSQPINFVDGTEAPLLLLYGNADETVKPRNIANLAAKAHQLGGRVETRYYDDIDHIGILASLSIPLRNRKPVLEDINRFITLHHVENNPQ